MITVGLTGGIGSGKSIIGQLFTCLGVPLFNSDDAGRSILETAPYKDQIIRLFGPEVQQPTGSLDRKKIADRVFSNPQLLKALNAIIHPAVGNSFKIWVKTQEQHPYIIKETAILFESGIQAQVDYIITVVASKELRIERIIKRSGLTATEITSRMMSQWPDEEKIKHSQFVIVNDETQLVIPQVIDIHGKLMVIAKNK